MSSNLTDKLRHQANVESNLISPRFFRITREQDSYALDRLMDSNPAIRILDNLESQLRDLIKLRHPNLVLSDSEYKEKINTHLKGIAIEKYGVWVYYPWSNTLIHLLDEEEFVQVRTIRNLYKITLNEQQVLRSKSIGVIGLSAGHSIAVAAAMERICGEIRIADFDILELSNLNRIRTSLEHLSLPKTTVVAREILEIDPFIKVKTYNNGINKENIEDFLLEGSKLDLLVEECDSLEIKILSRLTCKKLGIPVIMDTSDRGMLDVERFDLDPNYPILHGLVDESIPLDYYSTLKKSEDKLPFILPILGVDTLSTRLAGSGLQVGETITTWPQLYSDVALGGAAAAAISRRILLGQKIQSGRKWLDIEEYFEVSEVDNLKFEFESSLTADEIKQICDRLTLEQSEIIDISTLEALLQAASMAPSAGNNQKWRFVVKEHNVILIIDKHKSIAFSDNLNIASLINIGCAIENIQQKAMEFGLESIITHLDKSHFPAVSTIHFRKSNKVFNCLADQIEKRRTTRSNSAIFNGDKTIYRSSEARYSNNDIKLKFVEDREKILQIGKLICKADRIRFMNLQGHQEFFQHEVRWTRKESELKKDGLDINQFELSILDKMGLSLIKRLDVISFLNTINGGESLEKISSKCFNNADSIGYTITKGYNQSHLISTGQLIERFWLEATRAQLGIFPITVVPMMTSLLYSDQQNYLSVESRSTLNSINQEILKILEIDDDWNINFMMRTNGITESYQKSPRHDARDKTIFL
ncbi:MAG: Rv1355c family protein [Flavobacteriales bacterium]|nr:Rv1355c family protein [Flavobacteriales bacterium]